MSKVQKIKSHLRENRKVYIAASIGVVVGAVGALVLYGHGNKATIDSWKLINWKSPHTSQTLQVVLPQLGHPGNAVQCIENGTIYASQGEAARSLGVPSDYVSKHLRGELPNVAGVVLKKVTERGIPIAE